MSKDGDAMRMDVYCTLTLSVALSRTFVHYPDTTSVMKHTSTQQRITL